MDRNAPRRDRAAPAGKGTRRDGGAGKPPRRHRDGDSRISRAHGKAAEDCRRQCRRDEDDRQHAVGLVERNLAACAKRGAGVERGLVQRQDGIDRRRRIDDVDRRDRPSAATHQRRGASGGERGEGDRPRDRGARREGAEDRRRGQAHSRHRRADQPARAQCHDRSGARRRVRDAASPSSPPR